jgi:C_GCAxxG_C_C family probable redox protein
MISKDDVVNLAVRCAEEGFLCSEAVLMALARALAVSNEMIPRIATGFGAGVGHMGEICGAISGAVMGLSIMYGRDDPRVREDERRPYWYSKELLKRIEKNHNAVTCFGILGLDLQDPGDLEDYHRENHWETTCREMIREATSLAYDLLASEGLVRNSFTPV